MTTEHSWWSLSAGQRNIDCPASVKLNNSSTREPSLYADQGTACHDGVKEIEESGSHKQDFTEDWQEAAVSDALRQRDELLNQLGFVNYKKLVEHKVTFSHVGYPDVFGTADCLIYDQPTKTVVVIDYKFGAGVAVSPEGNDQELGYAFGSLGEFPDAEKFILVIIQPRLYDEALTWDADRQTVENWWKDRAQPAIELARSVDPPFGPGENQCRWCAAAKNGCPAQLQQLKSLLPDNELELTMDNTVTNDQLSDLLKRLPAYEQAIKQVKEVALSRMLQGQRVEGFKLIKSTKHRRWTDTKKVDGFLQRKKLKMDERYNMKLISPAQAEKALTARGLLTPRTLTAMRKYIETPEGDPVIAPASSKKPEYTTPNPVDELPINLNDIL